MVLAMLRIALHTVSVCEFDGISCIYLAIPCKVYRTHFGAIVRLFKRIDTSVANCIPNLNRAIQTARGKYFGIGGIFHACNAGIVLLRWHWTDKTLSCIDIIHA